MRIFSSSQKSNDVELKAPDHTLPRRPWRAKTTPWTDLVNHKYQGEGTEESPYVVTWLSNAADSGEKDPENPMTFAFRHKWFVTVTAAIGTLGVTLASSILSAGMFDIRKKFPGYNDQIYILVTSAYMIGFVLGPLIWGPGSEVFGRRKMFILTYIPFTAFNAACCGASSLPALIVLRTFAGIFGSSATVNSGGTIADMFAANQRGLAMAVFAAAPFQGPAIGPVIGGFLAQAAGWKWVAALIAFFSLFVTVLGTTMLPETYSPYLLRQRATRLSRYTGKVYRSQPDLHKPLDLKKLFMHQLKIPWILLFKEPIVLLMSAYVAVIYSILYIEFAAFPLIFSQARGWSPGISGLAFIGITMGTFVGIGYIVFCENPRYTRLNQSHGGYLPPEARLPSVLLGAVLFPIGLFWFAWTGIPASIHWFVPILGSVFVGTGLVLVVLGVMNYLVDSYLIYAASVLAGSAILRATFAVVLPLFTLNIYNALGIRWAGTLLAFLGLAFVPAPFVFYYYGSRIRRMSKAAREADDLGQKMADERLEMSNRSRPLNPSIRGSE